MFSLFWPKTQSRSSKRKTWNIQHLVDSEPIRHLPPSTDKTVHKYGLLMLPLQSRGPTPTYPNILCVWCRVARIHLFLCGTKGYSDRYTQVQGLHWERQYFSKTFFTTMNKMWDSTYETAHTFFTTSHGRKPSRVVDTWSTKRPSTSSCGEWVLSKAENESVQSETICFPTQ